MSINFKKHILYPLVDIVFPQDCVLCSKPNIKTHEHNFPVCIDCDNNIKFNPNIKQIDLDTNLYFLAKYENEVQTLVHEFKFNKIKIISRYFARKMYHAFSDKIVNKNYCAILPVPIHRIRFYEREYNQSFLFASKLGAYTNIKLEKKVLYKKKNTPKQSTLKREERLCNLKDAFQVKKTKRLMQFKRILLVDDLFTTGATTKECIKTIKEVNPDIVIDVAVIALA